MSKLPETIGYELQSRLDALTVAGMSCFHNGKITLHHDNKQRGRFSANSSGCPPGGTPSHRVPHHIEFNMTSVGEFPKMKNKPADPSERSRVSLSTCASRRTTTTPRYQVVSQHSPVKGICTRSPGHWALSGSMWSVRLRRTGWRSKNVRDRLHGPRLEQA